MKKVFVGLSGGVDSAVSAYLLQQQGYHVTGVFLKVWEPPFLPCTAEQDRLDAMRVAAHLGIPFISYDAEEAYRRGVVDYFINEYRAGRTPNPDVLCNRVVKFGVFWEKARADGADCIATGHYAQVREVRSSARTDTHERTLSERSAYAQSGDRKLVRGIDASKDQSYFLWTLTQQDLAHTLFPVGGLQKSEVRRIAQSIGLPNATKRDSQGLCFLGHVDMKEFLMHYLPVVRGDVLNEQGEIVGTHDGVSFYTLGERFPLPGSTRSYVIAKDSVQNVLTVAETPHTPRALKKVIDIREPHWISGAPPRRAMVDAVLRYHGNAEPAHVSGSQVVCENPVLATPGQSVLFYERGGDVCLGGAIVA